MTWLTFWAPFLNKLYLAEDATPLDAERQDMKWAGVGSLWNSHCSCSCWSPQKDYWLLPWSQLFSWKPLRTRVPFRLSYQRHPSHQQSVELGVIVGDGLSFTSTLRVSNCTTVSMVMIPVCHRCVLATSTIKTKVLGLDEPSGQRKSRKPALVSQLCWISTEHKP